MKIATYTVCAALWLTAGVLHAVKGNADTAFISGIIAGIYGCLALKWLLKP